MTLFVSDYLVGKVIYFEKKVQESLNKLNFVKDELLKKKILDKSNKPILASEITHTGDLLSHHLR